MKNGKTALAKAVFYLLNGMIRIIVIYFSVNI